MIKFLRIIIINIFIGLILSFSLELVFGYWFDKDNLGPYVREYRMRKNTYDVVFDKKRYVFEYKRNYYGFRGKEIPLDQISAVLVGGSTTDERYKPEEFTITEVVNKEISKEISNIKIFNAGIEGQSTRGHLANLKYWFPKLKNFKPKYLIYYIGINDQALKGSEEDTGDGVVIDTGYQRVWDNIKTRSIFYDLARRTKHKFYTSEKKILYDFDKGVQLFKEKQNIQFLNYNDFIKKKGNENALKFHDPIIKNYLLRVDKLYEETIKFGSIPIFINQVDSTGFENKLLSSMNIYLIKHCKKNKYLCIDLAKEINANQDYWWDGLHTTPKGSAAVGAIIAPKLIEILKAN